MEATGFLYGASGNRIVKQEGTAMGRQDPQRKLSIVRLREHCELQDIRLIESVCKQNLREDSLPDQLEIGVNAKAGMSTERGKIVYFPIVRAIARYPDSAPSESPLLIQAKYRVEYNLTSKVKDADEDELEEFVHNAANLHVWPYFRELVQSMTCKMGLPHLTIPLYDPDGFMTEVTEELVGAPARSPTKRRKKVQPKKKRKTTVRT